VHTHWVEVFDRADDDAVACTIAHDLHLVLFPAHDALFNEHFADGGELKPLRNDARELFGVRCRAAARATQGERGAQDNGVADRRRDLERLIDRVGVIAARGLYADLGHGLVEELAVLALLDGGKIAADQLHVVLIEYARFGQFHRSIERGLPAKGREQRIRLFALDDLLDEFAGDRLDIRAVDQVGVGHDGGGVAVHEHHAIALFLEHLARLRARVVELAGLADDDRA